MARRVWETIQVAGRDLSDAVHTLIEAGNVRRIRIRQGQKTIAEFPMTVGVVGVVFAPMLAAVGALAAIVTECSIDVERELEQDESRVPGAGSSVRSEKSGVPSEASGVPSEASSVPSDTSSVRSDGHGN